MDRTGKIVLSDAIKTFTDDQDKVISPQETLTNFKPRLRSLGLDVLSNTVRVDNGRLGIPVFFSVCGADARMMTGTKKQMGKGATKEQAEASAVMELAERYSFFSFYKNPNNVFINTYENLNCDSIPLSLIAKSVHDESGDFDISKSFFKSLPLKWTMGYNFTTKKEMAIPIDWFYAINEFNGSSAGNCIEEALCQGICEVVERHVSSLISKSKISTPSIKFESVTDLLVLDMLRKYSVAGIQLFATDFTFGVGIPSVGVLAYDPNTFPTSSEIVWTAGTAPNPQKALSRALTEVAQLAGDFNTGSNYVASGLPKFNSIDELAFITDSRRSVGVLDLPDISADNMKTEVMNCIHAINELHMDTIAVDITNPILKIPSLYTIIPGAHFRERAYETSVAMFSAKIVSENFPADEAIVRLKNMDKLLPDKYYLRFYIGKCCLELKKYDDAITYFYEALELEPNEQDMPSIYSYLAICFKEIGRYSDAIEVLNKGESLDNDRTDIHNLKGYCYFMLKNYEKSIRCFKKVINLDPSSAIDYANIASNYRDMGEKNKAIHYYKLALKIDPSSEIAVNNLNILTTSGNVG